jgi:hypothetical protein
MLEFVCEVIRNECQCHIFTGGNSVGLSVSLVWTVRYVSHGPETPLSDELVALHFVKIPSWFYLCIYLCIYVNIVIW